MPKAKRVLAGLQKGGWVETSCVGSHHKLKKGDETRIFSYHDNVELGKVQLKDVAKDFGFTVEQLKKLI